MCTVLIYKHTRVDVDQFVNARFLFKHDEKCFQIENKIRVINFYVFQVVKNKITIVEYSYEVNYLDLILLAFISQIKIFRIIKKNYYSSHIFIVTILENE